MEKSLVMNEKVLVPVGLAIAVIGAAAVWLTTMDRTAAAHSEKIQAIEEKQEKYDYDIVEVKKALIRIETKLEEKR